MGKDRIKRLHERFNRRLDSIDIKKGWSVEQKEKHVSLKLDKTREEIKQYYKNKKEEEIKNNDLIELGERIRNGETTLVTLSLRWDTARSPASWRLHIFEHSHSFECRLAEVYRGRRVLSIPFVGLEKTNASEAKRIIDKWIGQTPTEAAQKWQKTDDGWYKMIGCLLAEGNESQGDRDTFAKKREHARFKKTPIENLPASLQTALPNCCHSKAIEIDSSWNVIGIGHMSNWGIHPGLLNSRAGILDSKELAERNIYALLQGRRYN